MFDHFPAPARVDCWTIARIPLGPPVCLIRTASCRHGKLVGLNGRHVALSPAPVLPAQTPARPAALTNLQESGRYRHPCQPGATRSAAVPMERIGNSDSKNENQRGKNNEAQKEHHLHPNDGRAVSHDSLIELRLPSFKILIRVSCARDYVELMNRHNTSSKRYRSIDPRHLSYSESSWKLPLVYHKTAGFSTTRRGQLTAQICIACSDKSVQCCFDATP